MSSSNLSLWWFTKDLMVWTENKNTFNVHSNSMTCIIVNIVDVNAYKFLKILHLVLVYFGQ